MDAKYCYFHAARDAIEWHQTNEPIDAQTIDSIAECLIKTTKIKTYLDILKIYLDHGIPFNIISSPGSGIRYVSGCVRSRRHRRRHTQWPIINLSFRLRGPHIGFC